MNTAMEEKDVSILKERASSNRAAMPIVAAIVDELRAQGLSPKVVFASENGVTVGRRPRYENVFEVPAGIGKEAIHAPRRSR